MTDAIFEEDQIPTPDELTSLKEKAGVMGITFHPSIGVEALRAKINAKLNDQPEPAEEKSEEPFMQVEQREETRSERQQRLRRDALKLVRVVVTCMNPAKREWEGEMISVGNQWIGSHRKFVPFNVDVGYHVPWVIYEAMKERQCQIFYEGRDDLGNKVRRAKMVKEFAIEVLDPLTEAELKSLAQRQAMANGTAAA